MKRQKSYGEDLDSVNEKGVLKEWGRRDQEVTKMRSLKVLDSDADRSLHRRGFGKVENGRKGYSYDRSLDEDRDSSRTLRKRFDHVDSEGFERSGDCYGSSSIRRKEYGDSRDGRKDFEIGRQNRDRDSSVGFRDHVDSPKNSPKVSPRKVYGGGSDRMHRSNSFSVSRREFFEPPKFMNKGFRSERDRSKREDSAKFHVGGEDGWSYGSEEPCVSAWRRATSKEVGEDLHSLSRFGGRGNRMGLEDRGNGVLVSGSVRSPQGLRDIGKLPTWSKDSGQGLRDIGKSPTWSKDSGQGSKDVGKSPPWSKDSEQGSRDLGKSPCSKDSVEQSKSVELRKIEEENGQGCSSEMEEGELEPEPGEIEFKPTSELEGSPEVNFENGHEPQLEVDTEQKETIESEMDQEKEGVSAPVCKSELHGETEVKQEVISVGKHEDEAMDIVVEMVKESGEFFDHKGEAADESEEGMDDEESTEIAQKPDMLKEDSPSSVNHEACSIMEMEPRITVNGGPVVSVDVSSNPLNPMQGSSGVLQEAVEDVENQEMSLEGKRKLDKDIELEMEAEGIDTSDSYKDQEEENNNSGLALKYTTGRLNSEHASGPPNIIEADISNLGSISEKLLHKFGSEIVKDKGKSLVHSISKEADTMDNSCFMERDLLGERDRHVSHVGEGSGVGAVEGPTGRGFELFSGSTFKVRSDKAGLSFGKHKDKNPKVEPLELSLGLPDFSLAFASNGPNPAPSSPSRARSEHSVPTTFHTRTSSNGFTVSHSFSGSQSFVHNPSCSLTQNSFENYENSVGSHPIFQGVDQISQGAWQGQSSVEHIPSGSNGIMDQFKQPKEVPLSQTIFQNGNGVLQGSQASQGIFAPNNRPHALNYRESSGFEQVDNVSFEGKFSPMQWHKLQVSEGYIGLPNGLDRQLSLSRELAEQQRLEFRSSPTHSVGSRETRSEHSRQNHKDKKRLPKERNVVSFGNSETGSEKLIPRAIGIPERILTEIVSEPITVMARRFQEMTEQSITYLKAVVREMILNRNMHEQLCALQETLQRRSDLTLETLSKSHWAQLEILVSLKTGLQSFLRRTNNIPSSDLVDIFLNLKCRNLACRNALPVDECDCKICTQKNGFCNSCMCLVCSKFDMASNTCSWVGCDVCLHWCHTDCGLRGLHIRNGQSVTGTQGISEMQFHCIACNHPSEMFGFVKEVFKTCAKVWEAETLSKELEYVRRIFRASGDIRGKKLHNIAEQMLAKLENKINLSEVYNCIMSFLTESDSNYGEAASAFLVKEPFNKNPEGSNVAVTAIQQPTCRPLSVFTEKVPRLENGSGVLPHLDWEQVCRRIEDHKLPLATEKKPVLDELECVARVKQAEAKMFQARADGARKEAEGLKQIAVAKNEKIEEQYANQLKKLRLAEAEERRRQKLEEVQVLERAHLEYFNMKMRMEADIKNLLLKMEVTKQNQMT